jgi:hypothetical protein
MDKSLACPRQKGVPHSRHFGFATGGTSCSIAKYSAPQPNFGHLKGRGGASPGVIGCPSSLPDDWAAVGVLPGGLGAEPPDDAVSAVCLFATRSDRAETASAGRTTENAQNVGWGLKPFDCDQISLETAAARAGRRHLLVRFSHFSPSA